MDIVLDSRVDGLIKDDAGAVCGIRIGEDEATAGAVVLARSIANAYQERGNGWLQRVDPAMDRYQINTLNTDAEVAEVENEIAGTDYDGRIAKIEAQIEAADFDTRLEAIDREQLDPAWDSLARTRRSLR